MIQPSWPKRIRIKGVALIGAVSLLAMASACSPPKKAETPSSPGTVSGTLSLGLIGSAKDTVYPYVAQQTISGGAIWANVFDNLSWLAPDGSLRMALAESMTPNADKTTWTVSHWSPRAGKPVLG